MADQTERQAQATNPPPAPAKESFVSRMERLGGFSPVDSGIAHVDPTSGKAKPPPSIQRDAAATKARPSSSKQEAPAPPSAAAVDEMTQLETLAKKLGLRVDGGAVRATDRIALREERRALQQRVNEREQRLADAHRAFGGSVQRAQAIIKALDDGDADELAKLAGGKDWNEVQQRFISSSTDPNWKKIRDLERQIRGREESEQRAREQAQERAEREQQQAAEMRYRQQLSSKMKQSSDPVLREMSDEPALVDAIFQIQRENWDGDQTVTVEQALKMAVRGAGTPIGAELRRHFEKMKRAFEGAAPAAPAPSGAQKPKPKSTPAVQAPSRLARAATTSADRQAVRADALNRLRAAIREDRLGGR